jgi:hypothetical protein
MRADADLMVYVAARWPELVKEAVLLGVPPDRAADAATDALSRCRRSWERVSREENPDALVSGELARVASRGPRTSPETRGDAARELLVLAPPTLADLVHQARQNNRATLRNAGKVVVPLALVAAGAGAYFAVTGGADDTERPRPGARIVTAAVSRQENPAPGVVWYADGQLHLAHSVVAVEGLTNMTQLGAGVVYGDAKGRVVYLADDGTGEVLGHTDPRATVAATAENFWAAWFDTETRKLEVKEAPTGHVVAAQAVEGRGRVVAVDGPQIYYDDDEGLHVFSPGSEPHARPFLPGDLLDARSRITAFQGDPATIRVSQSFFSTVYDMPGVGAALSPDGDLVATRRPDGQVAVYDTASGKRLADGLAENDVVVAFSPGDDHTMTYVVAAGLPSPAHDLQLRTCQVPARTCDTAVVIPNTGSTPVLAR